MTGLEMGLSRLPFEPFLALKKWKMIFVKRIWKIASACDRGETLLHIYYIYTNHVHWICICLMFFEYFMNISNSVAFIWQLEMLVHDKLRPCALDSHFFDVDRKSVV